MSEHPATTTKGEVLLVLYKYVKVYFLHLSPQPTGPNLCPAMAGCVDQGPNMQVTLTPCSPCRSSLRILPRCSLYKTLQLTGLTLVLQWRAATK